jgi:hypothetical protein
MNASLFPASQRRAVLRAYSFSMSHEQRLANFGIPDDLPLEKEKRRLAEFQKQLGLKMAAAQEEATARRAKRIKEIEEQEANGSKHA